MTNRSARWRSEREARRRPRGSLVVGLVGLVAGGLATGCNQSSAAPFAIRIVTPEGGNPVSGVTSGSLRVVVAQDGAATTERTLTIEDGTFTLDVPITSYWTAVRLGVELTHDGTTSIGAVGSFQPGGFAELDLPVVPASTCAAVSSFVLDRARERGVLASVNAVLAVVGGTAGDGLGSDAAERFWAPYLTTDDVAADPLTLDASIGAASGVVLEGTTRIVVLGERAFVLDLGGTASADDVDTALDVHAGALGFGSLASVGALGAAIVGGSEDGGATGVATITWVAIDGSTSRSSLPASRVAPAVASAGTALYVAGGHATGEPAFAYVPTTAAERGEVVAFGDASIGGGGVLVASPDGTSALYLGALEGDAVGTATYLVTGCPGDCRVEPGPTWSSARRGVSVVVTDGATWLVGGRDDAGPRADVELVTWSSGTASIEAHGALRGARTGALATALEGGLVLVVGGRDATGVRGDAELCAPRALATID